jgi:hypothetical protein
MNEEQIKQLIQTEVQRQLYKEKKKLAVEIKNKLLYTGQYAGSALIMEAIDNW